MVFYDRIYKPVPAVCNTITLRLSENALFPKLYAQKIILEILASFKFSLHFLDAGYCFVPMLQRGTLIWYTFPRRSMGTRGAILH
ncbi:MAG: hypothetical protein B1H13_05685 [Desulfobacteraceae bacterium 4484_190.3]|nr:MAG: hypothetical protein B1H13_05685 [Desulfobacteraceae bacterium 4484_190.3]